MKEVAILVVQLTDAFRDFWVELAGDLGVGLRVIEDRDTFTLGPDDSAVIVSAGGAEGEAVDWLESHSSHPGVPYLAVGADTGHRTAARLVRAGARDYVALPGDVEILRNALAAAVEQRRSTQRRAAQRAAESKDEAFAEIIGDSAVLKAALSRAARILPHGDATVLVAGETGTGKELLARAIHNGGARTGAPFVPVNCTALPGALLESELFGHERGAFTDAHAAKPGLFEIAKGGTLFLDEIGDLAYELQAKLLRVLEDKQVRRVGATSWKEADVRIIAATNEELEQAVMAGTFRSDLFFRLSVITLSLPPLRERGYDAVVIAEALLDRLSAQHAVPRPPLSEAVRQALLTYHWPGNVRELKNAVERSLLLSPAGELNVEELLRQSPAPKTTTGLIPFPASLDEISAAAARSTLDLCQGNRSEAARRLGISRARLTRLINRVQNTA